MARPLPLMDYDSLVGDQLQGRQVPLNTQGVPIHGPSYTPSTGGNTPMPGTVVHMNMPTTTGQPKTYGEICQTIAEMQQANLITPQRRTEINQLLASVGYPPMSQCPHNKGPFQNETVQYLLLFLLAYVVIKKL